jgi:hypothetical protein
LIQSPWNPRSETPPLRICEASTVKLETIPDAIKGWQWRSNRDNSGQLDGDSQP